MAGHLAADLGQIGVGDRHLVHHPAVEHDDEAVGDFEDLVADAQRQPTLLAKQRVVREYRN
jgi:hypothetical protein